MEKRETNYIKINLCKRQVMTSNFFGVMEWLEQYWRAHKPTFADDEQKVFHAKRKIIMSNVGGVADI